MSRSHLDKLYSRHNGLCHYCLTKTSRKKNRQGWQNPATATREHVVPKSLGGPDSLGNYVLACSACNNRRGIILFFCRCEGCSEKVHRFLDRQENVDKMFWTIVEKNKTRIEKARDGRWLVIRLGYKTQRFEKWQQAIDFVAIVNSPVTIGRKNV